MLSRSVLPAAAAAWVIYPLQMREGGSLLPTEPAWTIQCNPSSSEADRRFPVLVKKRGQVWMGHIARRVGSRRIRDLLSLQFFDGRIHVGARPDVPTGRKRSRAPLKLSAPSGSKLWSRLAKHRVDICHWCCCGTCHRAGSRRGRSTPPPPTSRIHNRPDATSHRGGRGTTAMGLCHFRAAG